MLKYLFDHRRDHYYGHPMAPIEIIQYGDFQCENCAAVYPEIKMLQAELGNQLKLVFRHYPLPSIHPLAIEAAVATEAAALNDELKFWRMHDLIFENQKFLSRASLSTFAQEIQIDTIFLENIGNYKKLIQKVSSDFESGLKSGVDGTPSFFINRQRYNGFHDFQNLYKACNYLLNFKSRAA